MPTSEDVMPTSEDVCASCRQPIGHDDRDQWVHTSTLRHDCLPGDLESMGWTQDRVDAEVPQAEPLNG